MNYRLKQVLRGMQKHPGMVINKVLGWIIALTTALLGFLFIHYHLTFDSSFEGHEQIYRLHQTFKTKGVSTPSIYVRSEIGPTLATELPSVTECTRVSFDRDGIFRYDAFDFKASFHFADSNYFSFFTFPLESTLPKDEVLKEPFTVVISREVAAKAFGNENPINKTILYKDNGKELKVTGVVDVPQNTHLQYDILISNSTVIPDLPKKFPSGWTGGPEYFTYVKLADGVTREEVVAQLPAWFDDKINNHLESSTIYGGDLMTLEEMHLHSSIDRERSDFPAVYLYIFLAVVLFLIFIASINYVNLTLVGLYDRSKSYGIIKVLGGDSDEFKKLLMLECLIVLGISFFFTLVLTEMVLPYFSAFTEINFSLYRWSSFLIILGLGAFVVGLAFLLVFWPARVIAKFSPQKVIRGINEIQDKKLLSKVMMGIQFFVASVLIIATVVLRAQFAYLDRMDYHFSRDNILIYDLNTTKLAKNGQLICDEIINLSGVENAAMSSSSPGRHYYGDNMYTAENVKVPLALLEIGPGYTSMYNIPLVEGRFFDNVDFLHADSLIIVNRSFVKKMGVSNPVGQVVNGPYGGEYRILGVMEDIKFKPGKNSNIPMAFFQKFMNWNYKYVLNIKARPNADLIELKSQINAILYEFDQEAMFDEAPLQAHIDATYKGDSMIMQIVSLFSLIAIFLACLSLLGISSYVAKKQAKEVAIRKVLGASVSTILLRQLYIYLKVVLIANLIALPIAYFGMQRWLLHFVDRTPLHWYYFLLAIVLCVFIAKLSVMNRVLKAVRMNPLDAIKEE